MSVRLIYGRSAIPLPLGFVVEEEEEVLHAKTQSGF